MVNVQHQKFSGAHTQ